MGGTALESCTTHNVKQIQPWEPILPPSSFENNAYDDYDYYDRYDGGSRYRSDDDDRDSYDREEFTPYTGYYQTGDGDCVFAMQGESRDYTACGSDCGYCGRCGY